MIAVISDIHDNLPNLKTALDYAKSKNVSALFVLGDITNAQTLKYLAANFSGPIYLVAGNMEVCDLEAESKKYPQIDFLGRHGGIIKIGDKLVGLCHEPSLIDSLLKNCHSRAGGNPDDSCPEIVFYGHTHKPYEEQREGVRLINPGNLANVFYAPTFALWDENTDKLELKIL